MHRLPYGSDMWFHWQEITELTKSHLLLPLYSFNSFYDSGSAVPTMYPYLFLYPFIVFFKIFKSIALTTYLMLIIDTLMALLVSYYSSLSINKDKATSYIFALMYSISFPLILNTFGSYDIGMNNAFIFIPLVLFGFIDWLRYKKWLMLSIGMSLIIYSNVIFSIFVPPILLGWLIYNYRSISKSKFINLIKAIVLTGLTTALFWLPALKLFALNKLKSMKGPFANSNGVDLFNVIHSAFSTTKGAIGDNTDLATIYVIIGLIIGLMCFKKYTPIFKQSYIISVLIILFSSNLMPWRIINKTPLGNIQMPWRLYLIPQVLLTYMLSVYVTNLIRKHCHSSSNKLIVIIGVIASILCLQMSYQSSYIHMIYNQSCSNSKVFGKKHPLTNPNSCTGVSDYYPIQSMNSFNNIVKHQALENNHKFVTVKPKGNGTFAVKTNTRAKTLSIPFIYYNGSKYNCYLDGKKIKSYPNVNQLQTFKNINKGHHYIKITTPTTINMIIARLLTLISFLIYISLVFRYFKRRLI